MHHDYAQVEGVPKNSVVWINNANNNEYTDSSLSKWKIFFTVFLNENWIETHNDDFLKFNRIFFRFLFSVLYDNNAIIWIDVRYMPFHMFN